MTDPDIKFVIDDTENEFDMYFRSVDRLWDHEKIMKTLAEFTASLEVVEFMSEETYVGGMKDFFGAVKVASGAWLEANLGDGGGTPEGFIHFAVDEGIGDTEYHFGSIFRHWCPIATDIPDPSPNIILMLKRARHHSDPNALVVDFYEMLGEAARSWRFGVKEWSGAAG